MQRISICGNSGAGKSTFAQKLSQCSKLPVYHLDRVQFRPDWELTPEAEFNAIHQKWLAQPSWIIEGVGPWPALKSRFEAADTLIYLDFPPEYCVQMARKRLEEDRLAPNPFLPENAPYAAKADKQETVIHFFQREWRPKILKLLESLREDRNVFIFTQPDALEDFLQEIKFSK